MKFRSMILVLTIAFSAIFVSMIGTSYAYYVATDGTEIEVTTGNIDTGTAVIFEESQYININNAIPGKEYNNNFIIIPNEDILGDKEYIVEIGITDIYIDEELKSEDFEINLTCTVPPSPSDPFGEDLLFEPISGTDFTDKVITDNYLSINYFSRSEVSMFGGEIDCHITVGIKETGENQNYLMNKKFRGLIKVNTMFK